MRNLFLVLGAAALALTSCITVGTPTPVNRTPEFVTATLPPTRTPFGGSPTAAVSLTPTEGTALPTADPNCKDSAVLLQDVTIADGTNVAYGAKFTKTWQFSNTGTCSWHGYTIVFVSGDRMGAPDNAPVSDTAAKSTVNVSVDLTAPTTDGIYTGVFELRNSRGQALAIGIEKSFWVKISVGNATVPTVAAPTSASVATQVSGGTGTTPKPPGSCKSTASPTYASEIVDLINNARTDAGLPALTVNAQLAAAAQSHSTDMACFSLLSHSGSNGSTIQQRVADAGFSGNYVQEMIYADRVYPQTAFDWWMNDAIHRAVIMDPHINSIGAGYSWVSDSAYGGYYTVDVGAQ